MDALYFEYARIIVGIIGFGSAVIGPSLFPFCFHFHNNTYHYPVAFDRPKVCRTLSPLSFIVPALGLLILPTVGWVYFSVAFGLGILNALIVWALTG